MAALNELEQFDAEVFRIETDTVWKGGDEGPANKQGKSLANRTKWLKAQIEALGNGKQPLDATLTALAALATVADRLIYSTGPDTFALTQLSAFIRTLLDDADAATARATLGAISQAQLDAAINGLLNGAGPALDTLNELAAALGNDANFAATVNNAIALRLAITDYQKATAATAAAGGTADAITAVFAPAITTDLAGRIPTVTVMIIAQATNTGAGLTIDVGTGAFGVVKGAGGAIVAGDVHGAGHALSIRGVRGANAAADKWVLLNPANGVAGSVVYASSAEAQALSLPNKSISPGGLAAAFQGANQSQAASGYQKLPGGLILQWGTTASLASGASTGTITFPVAFPANCAYLNFIGTSSATVGNNTNLSIASKTNANFSFVNSYLNTTAFNWLAIGY